MKNLQKKVTKYDILPDQLVFRWFKKVLSSQFDERATYLRDNIIVERRGTVGVKSEWMPLEICDRDSKSNSEMKPNEALFSLEDSDQTVLSSEFGVVKIALKKML